jgi:hypothetical protein
VVVLATRVGGSGVGCGGGVSAFAGLVIAIVVTGVAVTPAFVSAESDGTVGALPDRLGAAGALAASAAAVAAACFLIVPVISSIVLSSSAMRPASRSRSVLSVRIWAAMVCVSDSNWVILEGIRAIADDSLAAKI